MTGILAQLIALTAYGNDFLKNKGNRTVLDSTNTTFQFCNKVDFREFKKQFFFLKVKERVVAESPAEWFSHIQRNRGKHLRVYYESSKDQNFAKDHKLAGLVGGGGTWLIEAIRDGYSNYWANRWQVTNQNDPDHKIWTVNYGMNAGKQPITNQQIDAGAAKDKLRATLTEIADFAYNRSWRAGASNLTKP